VSQRSRLRSQDGFIREVIWIVVILAVIAVVVLDGMAIFRAYQSADDATSAADEALTEYAQSMNVGAAKQAAEEYLTKSGIEMVGFESAQTENGTVKFTVTAKATADTYAFRYLAAIPPLEDWVERTTHPTRTGSAE
jgi:Flp pilus assembly protein TadG